MDALTYLSNRLRTSGKTNLEDSENDEDSPSESLLMSEDCSVMDVCEMVGYKDLKYFSRLFKKITGISPSDYRKLYR